MKSVSALIIVLAGGVVRGSSFHAGLSATGVRFGRMVRAGLHASSAQSSCRSLAAWLGF